MAVPTLDKTGGAAWQFNVNLDAGGTPGATADGQDAMYKIKSALKGFGSSPWTCWGSRGWNGSSGNLDNGTGVDGWTATTFLTWAAAGSNHSWIVLQQAGLGTKTAVCIDLNYASAYYCSIIFSPSAGFGLANGGADGTATARPTASDEIVLVAAGPWGWANSQAFTKGLHVMQSGDGQCTRVLLCRGNVTSGIWIFDKAKNPIAAWTNPVMATVKATEVASPAEQCTYANFNDAAALSTKYGATTVTNYMTSAFYGVATVGENVTVPDDNTLEWPFNSIGLASLTAAHRGGRKGEVFDLWWGSTGVATGITYPEDGTKQFAQFGHLIFPWNSFSTPKIA